MPVSTVITCEHGGNRVPPPYRHLFSTEADLALLASHRGYDPGALTLAEELSHLLAAPLVASTVSRLLVDLNRSPGHPHLHARAVRDAPPELRREIIEHHYRPYRAQAEGHMQERIRRDGRVLHLSCHSFTPELDGHVRDADIGLLYDPRRKREAAFCAGWKAALEAGAPRLKVRRNYPYEGRNDGFTTYLRRRFSAEEYLGIELEINQKHVLEASLDWQILRAILMESFRLALAAG